jgi:hypothetical protein
MRRLSAAGTLACLLYAAPATESVRFGHGRFPPGVTPLSMFAPPAPCRC